jgi:hypothetical protein
MRVNLGTLGLAFLAMIATSAVVASTAQATPQFTADQYPYVVTGKQEGATNYFESTPGFKVECADAIYEATATDATASLTVTPHYSGCVATQGGLEPTATFHLNGCHYSLTAPTAITEEDVNGQAAIKCPEGKRITITVVTCQIHLKEQSLGGASGEVTYTNKAAGGETPKPYVTVDLDITEKIHYEETDGFLCPFSGNNTGTNGSLVSSVLVKGYEDLGSHAHPTTAERVQYTEGEEIGIDVNE